MTATLCHIWIYPIKSLDGVPTRTASFLASGPLENDRRWAIVDEAGVVVNGKRTPRVHQVRASFDDVYTTVMLACGQTSICGDLATARPQLEHWLTAALGLPVQLREDAICGFPDDRQACGPTLVSTATLEAIASWFPGMTLDECRRRFRANLEVNGCPAFAEDRLFQGRQPVRFTIGDVQLEGVNPCQRCVVPSRAAETGDVWLRFQREFAERRAATLPAWADRTCFDHFYRLAVNTRLVPGQGKRQIQIGDELTM